MMNWNLMTYQLLRSLMSKKIVMVVKDKNDEEGSRESQYETSQLLDKKNVMVVENDEGSRVLTKSVMLTITNKLNILFVL